MPEEIKVLCVDDEQNVLNSLRRLFMDEDYTVLTASSGKEGISILEREAAQIVISDYRMPSMNGVEFLEEVYKRWPQTVRIVLSGYADASAIVGAINVGHIYKFIPKPWNDEELKVTIKNSIERYYLYKKNLELTQELKAKNEELRGLLEEKSRSLEIRTRSLSIHQSLLDALPVGILGIDNAGMVVMCNAFCLDFCHKGEGLIGNDVCSVIPRPVVEFIEKVKASCRASAYYEHEGAKLRLIGKVVEDQGVILVAVPEDMPA